MLRLKIFGDVAFIHIHGVTVRHPREEPLFKRHLLADPDERVDPGKEKRTEEPGLLERMLLFFELPDPPVNSTLPFLLFGELAATEGHRLALGLALQESLVETAVLGN